MTWEPKDGRTGPLARWEVAAGVAYVAAWAAIAAYVLATGAAP